MRITRRTLLAAVAAGTLASVTACGVAGSGLRLHRQVGDVHLLGPVPAVRHLLGLGQARRPVRYLGGRQIQAHRLLTPPTWATRRCWPPSRATRPT